MRELFLHAHIVILDWFFTSAFCLGAYSPGETPVPIPNTAVKLRCANGSTVPPRKSRSVPRLSADVPWKWITEMWVHRIIMRLFWRIVIILWQSTFCEYYSANFPFLSLLETIKEGPKTDLAVHISYGNVFHPDSLQQTATNVVHRAAACLTIQGKKAIISDSIVDFHHDLLDYLLPILKDHGDPDLKSIADQLGKKLPASSDHDGVERFVGSNIWNEKDGFDLSFFEVYEGE